MTIDLNKITVQKKDIVMRHCEACGTKTAHVGAVDATRNGNAFAGGVQKQPFNTCIQCWVDSNDVNEWSRWIDPETGKRLEQPRGPEKNIKRT